MRHSISKSRPKITPKEVKATGLGQGPVPLIGAHSKRANPDKNTRRQDDKTSCNWQPTAERLRCDCTANCGAIAKPTAEKRCPHRFVQKELRGPSIFSTRKTPKRLRVRNRARAIDGRVATSGSKPAASPAATSPPSPFGFPVSDASRKFALRAKDTENRARYMAVDIQEFSSCISRIPFEDRHRQRTFRVFRPSGRISVSRGKPKTED